MLRPVNRAFIERPAMVFAAVLLWKLLLLAIFALPPPSNDSFFYDAPAVNLIVRGKFAAPPLELALPISAREAFSAYPPLYPLAMAAWMKVWGTSAVAAMWLHWLLFAASAVLVLATCRRLGLAPWAISMGGLFLLAISFHDRPDSLAHVFGLGAVYAMARWLEGRDEAGEEGETGAGGLWAWGIAAGLMLAVGTGLQIGALYFAAMWLGMALAALGRRRRLPAFPMTMSLLVPGLLVALVIFGFPRIWEGFVEHARQTPSVTGWRLPSRDQLLKLGRTLPGVLAMGALWLWMRPVAAQEPSEDRRMPTLCFKGGNAGLVFTALLIPSVLLAGASMVFFTPNGVSFAAWLQPLIVAAGLTIAARTKSTPSKSLLAITFALLALLGSIRMLGLSTWGIALARDCGYKQSIRAVREHINRLSRGAMVVSSAAYLYEAAAWDVRAIHCDWLGVAGLDQEKVDWEGLIAAKPPLILLTQFDYYRRYEPLLNRLKARPDLASVSLRDYARLSPPDANRALRRVAQHLSWAPIILEIEWSRPGEAPAK